MNVSENIEAAQWFPDQPHPAVETNVLEAGMARELYPHVIAAIEQGKGAFRIPKNWLIVEPGDWIVTRGGRHELVRQADFEKRYTVT